MTLALAALGAALLESNRWEQRRRRPRNAPKMPVDLLRRVAQGGRAVDHRAVIRFGLHDANEPEETRRKIA